MSEEELIYAYAKYMRDRDYLSAMALCRALRLGGHAADAQDLCFRWMDKVSDPFECAQLGIDMNFLGMFIQSRDLLNAVVGKFPYGVNRYLVQSELSIALYLLGRYHEAHAIYQTLRDTGEAENLVALLFSSADDGTRKFLRERYLGITGPVAGKHVLILQEGGFGDLVMYSRYIDLLVDEGAQSVHVQALPHLQPSLRTDERVQVFYDLRFELQPEHYVVTTMFSLFARYQMNPYFPNQLSNRILPPDSRTLDPTAIALVDGKAGARKIGLIWRSASDVRHEPYRSIELRMLVPLLESHGCRFIALQVGGISDAERALFERYNIVDVGSQISTFCETSAVMSRLDLLISIDTGPAHLASTIGCPVWLLLSQACDSRWYDSQRFTPWYPTMRLYRQHKLGDWSLPLNEMRVSLSAL